MPADPIPSMTRRRDQRNHNVIGRPFPVATRDMLADALHLTTTHTADQINQPLLALILARKAINDARLACSAAKRQWPGDSLSATAVRDRLDEIMETLRETMEQVPLSIVG